MAEKISSGENREQLPFTGDAVRLLAAAHSEAERLLHDYVGTEHVVLALTQEGEGVAVATFEHLGVDRDKVRQTLGETVVSGRNDPGLSGERPYTSRTKAALSFAADSARERGHAFIDPADLVVGLLREKKNIGAQVLGLHGLTAAAAFRMIRELDVAGIKKRNTSLPSGEEAE